jgi:hypothetical protein
MGAAFRERLWPSPPSRSRGGCAYREAHRGRGLINITWSREKAEAEIALPTRGCDASFRCIGFCVRVPTLARNREVHMVMLVVPNPRFGLHERQGLCEAGASPRLE